MPGLKTKHTLLATLGGQPQVVTFTLDLLLQRGIPISEVIVIHPATKENLQHSIELLYKEFVGNHYRNKDQTIHFHRQVLSQYGQDIDDIVDEWTANGALDTIHELVQDLKQQQRCIHFSITGGRRLMGFLAFSAALINFDQSDHLWHIHTPNDVKKRAMNGAMMHAKPQDGIRLIEVPFSRAAQPIFSRLLTRDNASSATQIIDAEQEQARRTEEQHCQNLISRLSEAQYKVLHAFAQGLTPQQVAEKLNINIKTVDTHKSVILREYRNEWQFSSGKRVDYNFLRNSFIYFVFDSDNEQTHTELSEY